MIITTKQIRALAKWLDDSNPTSIKLEGISSDIIAVFIEYSDEDTVSLVVSSDGIIRVEEKEDD